MKTRTKLLITIGISAVVLLGLIAGGWLINTASAQGPWQGGNWGGMHNNQAILALLKSDESELQQQRQQGKSWLDIATAKAVSEQELSGALLQPMTQMQGWMTQNYPQSNAAQMTEWMRQQIAQDIRVSQFGTMTDMHVFGGTMMGNWNGKGFGGMMNGLGMMGNWNGSNGFGGMMSGSGMMGNWNGNNGSGGMMNGYGMMGRGMMGGWNNTPNVNVTPVPSTHKVDREIQLTAHNFQFDPTHVTAKAGETVKFTIVNQDNFAHNAVSQGGALPYTVLPANQTTSILWAAPKQAGTYTVICTWHPGMQFQIVVE